MTVADVNAVAKAFHDGVANKDAAALASLYHDDARFLPLTWSPPKAGKPSEQPCDETKILLDCFNSNLPLPA